MLQAILPTPVFNRPDLKSIFSGNSLPLDNGHFRVLEMIALKGTIFFPIRQYDDLIYEVAIEGYNQSPLYIDRRFIKKTENKESDRKLPSSQTILERLHRMLGTPYVWGGNWSEGIPQMCEFYPPSGSLTDEMKTLWSFQGVDCSGFLYQATDGFIPRNTNELFHFGTGIPIEGKSLEKIVQPLDLVIWKEHMFIIFDETRTIECSFTRKGVLLRPLKDRFEELLEERKPADHFIPNNDSYFLVRRFI